jgi:hypothetical protein
MKYLKLYEDYGEEEYQPIRKIGNLSDLKYLILDDKSLDYIKKCLVKLFGHDKFFFNKFNIYKYSVIEMVNSRFTISISLLEDDYYLLESQYTGFFICDGFSNLFKKIKADFNYIKVRLPEMYIQSHLFNINVYPEIDIEVQQLIQSKIKPIYPDLDVEILTKSEPSLFGNKYHKILILKKDDKRVGEIIKERNEENISGEVDINFTFYYITFLKRISSINWKCYGVKGLIEVIGDKLYSTEETVKTKIDAGKSIDAKELKLLSDEDKKKWLNNIIELSPTFNLSDTEFKVLNDDLIKFYIDLLFEKGKGFLTKKQFASLSDEMKLYFIKLKGKTRLRDDQKRWLQERT